MTACCELHDAGVVAVQHPDSMLAYAPKDTLFKLRATPVGLPDTDLYADRAELEARLPVLRETAGCAELPTALQVRGAGGWGSDGCMRSDV